MYYEQLEGEIDLLRQQLRLLKEQSIKAKEQDDNKTLIELISAMVEIIRLLANIKYY